MSTSEVNKNMSPTDIFSQLQLKKDFLKRPEGRIGAVAGILVLLFIFGTPIKLFMDDLASIAWDGVSALIAVVSFLAIAGLSWALAPVVFRAWQVYCRNMHRWFVRQAPLAHLYAYREDKMDSVTRMHQALGVSKETYRELTADRKSKNKEARDIEARINALGTEQALPGDDFNALNQQALALSEYINDLNDRISTLEEFIKKAETRIRSREKNLEVMDLKIHLAESKLKQAGSMKALNASIRKDLALDDEMSDGMVSLRFIDEEYNQAEGSFDALDFEMERLDRKDRLDALLANAEGLSRLRQAVANSEVPSASPTRTGQNTRTRVAPIAGDSVPAGADDDPYARAFGSQPNIKI